ncbi:MAG: 50S ribosomal protein L3, partial [Syntrophales bacterium]
MTQVFTEDGEATPATVIKVEPSVVIQKKTVQREGYDAVQIGCGRVKQKHVTKPLQGHFQKADKGFFRILRELRGDVSGFELGQEVRVDVFKPGDYVDITGTSKGKGFAGVIKRHGFRGG